MGAPIAAYTFLARSKSDFGAISPVLARTGGYLSDQKQSKVGATYADLHKVTFQSRRFTVAT
jgi:hypothetical protein